MHAMNSARSSDSPHVTGLGVRFWRLALSAGASNLADGIFKLALPLAAIAFTRSPTLVAGLELVRSLPWLLFALPVGALTDRLDRRRTLIAANVARASFVGVLAAVLQTENGSIALLYVVAAGTGVAEVFYDTSSQSILPSLVERKQLGRANGRLGAIELGTQAVRRPTARRRPRRARSGRSLLDHDGAVGVRDRRAVDAARLVPADADRPTDDDPRGTSWKGSASSCPARCCGPWR